MVQLQILTHRAHSKPVRQELEPHDVKFSCYFDPQIKFDYSTNGQELQWWHVEELATRFGIIAFWNALTFTSMVVLRINCLHNLLLLSKKMQWKYRN